MAEVWWLLGAYTGNDVALQGVHPNHVLHIPTPQGRYCNSRESHVLA